MTSIQVGNTLEIVVRNQAQFPFSMHPHGVFYNKSSEGASYADNSTLNDNGHGFVQPGEQYTYRVSAPRGSEQKICNFAQSILTVRTASE